MHNTILRRVISKGKNDKPIAQAQAIAGRMDRI